MSAEALLRNGAMVECSCTDRGSLFPKVGTRRVRRFKGKGLGSQSPKVSLRSRDRVSGLTAIVVPKALPHLDVEVAHSLRHSLEHVEVLRHSLSLALEPLYMPCSGLKCGDMVYRSTLDPALRLEERGINPYAIGLGGAVATYLLVHPGIFPGFIDYYFLAPLFGLFRKKLSAEDISMGKKIGSGGFGDVYRAKLKGPKEVDIVVKKAYEYGEAEAWMNERLERVCPNRIATFIDAFDGPMERKGIAPPLWLVWNFEGEGTLADAIKKKNFPENLEEKVFGEPLDKSLTSSRRHALVIRVLLKEILTSLKDIHATGIVHRDVKPQNILLSASKGGKLKLIDFGAAADLRIGINYLPKEFLLDPRYAPPEKYIMSTSTPKAPPTPVAALLSPVLWNLNRPDRFDMYSVGILLVQMCFPALRKDNQLVAFNRTLEKLDYDILKWRDTIASKRGDYSAGIKILDLDNGRGWDLLRLLISNNPSKRISASAAASHPFVSNNGLGLVPVLLERLIWSPYLEVAGARMVDDGQLTEVEVDLLGDARNLKKTTYSGSRTIKWWLGRQQRKGFSFKKLFRF